MNLFKHHPDNIIYILTDESKFQCSLEQFKTFEPKYELPEGFTGREYKQEVENRLFTSNSEVFEDIIWAEGDKYISKINVYIKSLAKLIEEENKLKEKVVIEQHNLSVTAGKQVDKEILKEQKKAEKEATKLAKEEAEKTLAEAEKNRPTVEEK